MCCPQHLIESRIAIEDGPVITERHGAFAHLFEDDTVRVVGAFQGVDLLARWSLHHQGVNLPLTDRTYCFLRLFQSAKQHTIWYCVIVFHTHVMIFPMVLSIYFSSFDERERVS